MEWGSGAREAKSVQGNIALSPSPESSQFLQCFQSRRRLHPKPCKPVLSPQAAQPMPSW